MCIRDSDDARAMTINTEINMNVTVEKPVENQKIDNYYICANKVVREDKNGNKFLLLRLMNTNGIIGAVKWRVDAALVESFEQGQVVKATGRVKKSSYRDPVSYTHLTLPTIYSV